jgi:hypothetical protein
MLNACRLPHPSSKPLHQAMTNTHHSNGQPREGYLNLTRRMENEDEDQFDVDLTILDFLVYKAIGLVFEWRSSSDPYHSDLPNALVNMTAGMTCADHNNPSRADENQIGDYSSGIGTMADASMPRRHFDHVCCSSP